MKETILITGAGPNGITGRRIKELLSDKFDILAPSSKELDLINENAVDEYFANNKIDYIIHCALQSPSRGHQVNNGDSEIDNNLRMFFNLSKHQKTFRKMFYLGSGAEYNKEREIVNENEEAAVLHVPNDPYGFTKYVLNQYTIRSKNIYNLRVFGTINPYEPANKNVVSNLCAKAVKGLPLTLNRDCVFSFIDIDDVIAFIEYGIKNELTYHDYNLCGWSGTIGEIADKVNLLNKSNLNVSFKAKGKNRQYTGNNKRLKAEYTDITDIDTSVAKVLEYMRVNKDAIEIESLDARWK